MKPSRKSAPQYNSLVTLKLSLFLFGNLWSGQKLRKVVISMGLGIFTIGVMALGRSVNSLSLAQQISEENNREPARNLTGEILIDGASELFSISTVMAEGFVAENLNVEMTIGISGSGGGLEKICRGEVDISNSTRPIKQSEIELCANMGIDFVEIPIAFEAIAVLANSSNFWLTCMTPQELGAIWAPAAEGNITHWSDVRKEFPTLKLDLYGPSTGSKTYDYFTAITIGREGSSRGDYTTSKDQNIIIAGLLFGGVGGLGFLNFADYEANINNQLQVIEIENSNGDCVAPNRETIADGTYHPLARPLFAYIRLSSLEDNPMVAAFVKYQLDAINAHRIEDLDYIPLPANLLEKVMRRIENKTTGSIYGGGSSVGIYLADHL